MKMLNSVFFFFWFRSPSISTIRDIDPKLPAARPSLEGYPLSDGEWPGGDRYVSRDLDVDQSAGV